MSFCFSRRSFLFRSAATAAIASIKLPAYGATPVSLKVNTESAGALVPANFVGLSYEVQELSDPKFFSPDNAGLIARFRALAPMGVLRLGGSTSNAGWWKPTPNSTKPRPTTTSVMCDRLLLA